MITKLLFQQHFSEHLDNYFEASGLQTLPAFLSVISIPWLIIRCMSEVALFTCAEIICIHFMRTEIQKFKSKWEFHFLLHIKY